MSNENTELLDAEEFRDRLIRKVDKSKARPPNTDDIGKQEKGEQENAEAKKQNEKEERELEESIRIGKYLDELAPDWRSMRATRLYKHIQSMLDKADQIRRFEIDLVWRRAIYLSPLFVIFFAAFGGVFYMIYDTDYTASGIEIRVDPREEAFLFFVLFLIALANAFLSFCLAKMNIASHKWQENWEHHVDYLQAILGVNMIRVKLPSITRPFTVRKTNILISVFIFAVWFLAALFCFLNFFAWYVFCELLLLSYWKNMAVILLFELILALIMVSPFTFLLGFSFCNRLSCFVFFPILLFYRWIVGKSFCEGYDAVKEEDIHISDLQLFSYKRESEELTKKDK